MTSAASAQKKDHPTACLAAEAGRSMNNQKESPLVSTLEFTTFALLTAASSVSTFVQTARLHHARRAAAANARKYAALLVALPGTSEQACAIVREARAIERDFTEQEARLRATFTAIVPAGKAVG